MAIHAGTESSYDISVRDDAFANQTNTKPRFMKVKDEYELKDFRIITKLGKGAFADVYLVELDPRLNNMSTSNQGIPMVFAMKVIEKNKIFAGNFTKYVKTERDILASFT